MAMLGLVPTTASPAEAREWVKIAFVDIGNTGRSVSAEALAQAEIRRSGRAMLLISRAVDLDPFETRPEAEVVRLLAVRGLDVSAHRAAALTMDDVRHADLILTMTARHREQVIERFPAAAARTFTLAQYAAGESSDIADAKGQLRQVYQQMLGQLERLVPLALARAAAP